MNHSIYYRGYIHTTKAGISFSQWYALMIINHSFIEKALSDYAILQTELECTRISANAFNITPAELMKVYSLAADTSAFQAILSNDRQYQVTSYILRTTKGFMDSLPAEERALIEARYIKCLTWVVWQDF